MKSSRKHYEDLLDELWRICIAVRDDRICQYTLLTTGKRVPGKDAHHIFSRSRRNTRWVVDNGILLKAGHNYSDAHKNPERFRRFLLDNWFTTFQYETLFAMAETVVNKPDYDQFKDNLIYYLKTHYVKHTKHSDWVIERVKKFKKCWPITDEEKNRIIEQAEG